MAQQVNPALAAKHDQMCLAMVQEAGGLNPFLDQVFRFLQTRTDFYHEAEPGDKMGFPPQYSEQLIFSFYKKYKDVHEQRYPPKGEALVNRWKAFQEQQKAAHEAKQAKAPEAKPQAKPQAEPVVEEEKKQVPAQAQAQAQAVPVQSQLEQTKRPEAEKSQDEKFKEHIANNPMEARDNIDKSISTYNGGATEKYKWSQQLHNVDVQIKLPPGTKARQILCVIKSKHLKVQLKNSNEVILDGELLYKVKVDDSFWNVEDDEYLNINLEKLVENIWSTVIVGDQEIDTSKVDNSKRVEDFDLETQGHLQKVLYERDRKMKGLPTTEEEQQQKLMNEIMKKNPNGPLGSVPYDPEKYGRKDGVKAPAIPFAQ